jgi:hypothetical protein
MPSSSKEACHPASVALYEQTSTLYNRQRDRHRRQSFNDIHLRFSPPLTFLTTRGRISLFHGIFLFHGYDYTIFPPILPGTLTVFSIEHLWLLEELVKMFRIEFSFLNIYTKQHDNL